MGRGGRRACTGRGLRAVQSFAAGRACDGVLFFFFVFEDGVGEVAVGTAALHLGRLAYGEAVVCDAVLYLFYGL